jgi:predicted dehydrogenase
MRVGVIGLGVISRFHLAALATVDGVQLAAACDRDETALGPLREHVECYRDHRRLLQHADVDAVIVTVPNDLHASVAHDALAAGKAVCVEKPLATRLSDGRALDAYARQHGLVLFTALHRRYNRALETLPRKEIRSMTVRYLELIEEHAGRDAWYLDPVRCGGGCVADNGPNAFDLVRHLAGDVEPVAAKVERDERGVDRFALIDLRAANGAEVRVELDWAYRGEIKDVVVNYADGSSAYADLLRGVPGFKDSLWHEYEGIVRNFRDARPGDDAGLAALSLVDSVYTMEGR